MQSSKLLEQERQAFPISGESESVSRPTISLFFPVYNDDQAVEALTEKAVRILAEISRDHEIVIVDDGSSDGTGDIADRLAARHPTVRVIHHPINRGYGHAIRTGFLEVGRMDWIVFTDGDNQYDIAELRHFLPLLPHYDAIVGFRYQKTYGWFRKFLSFTLNRIVRTTFGIRIRDITCGFKMVRRSVMEGVNLTSTGPFGGGEVAVRALLRGCPVGEVGISMYPRDFGRSSIISVRNILRTLADIHRLRKDIFQNRSRGD